MRRWRQSLIMASAARVVLTGITAVAEAQAPQQELAGMSVERKAKRKTKCSAFDAGLSNERIAAACAFSQCAISNYLAAPSGRRHFARCRRSRPAH